MPKFVITTTSGAIYSDGEKARFVQDLATIGAEDETLDRFTYEADFVVLHYGDYTLSIPEARIERIVEHYGA